MTAKEYEASIQTQLDEQKKVCNERSEILSAFSQDIGILIRAEAEVRLYHFSNTQSEKKILKAIDEHFESMHQKLIEREAQLTQEVRNIYAPKGRKNSSVMQ